MKLTETVMGVSEFSVIVFGLWTQTLYFRCICCI